MSRKTVYECDRCRSQQRSALHFVDLDGKRNELCDNCFDVLKSWISRDNTTSPGDRNRPKGMRGPGWREVCTHYVPCGGPCPDPAWRRT